MDATLQELFNSLAQAANAMREAIETEDADRIDSLYAQSRPFLKKLVCRLSELSSIKPLDSDVKASGDAVVAQWQGFGADIHALSQKFSAQLERKKKINRNVGRLGGIYAPNPSKSGRNLRYDIH